MVGGQCIKVLLCALIASMLERLSLGPDEVSGNIYISCEGDTETRPLVYKDTPRQR